MFTWYNNLRMGAKLILAFLFLSVLTGGIIGGFGYWNLQNVNQILREITGQRVTSVKNATAVERFSLRTIQQEMLYLLSINDVRLDSDAYQKATMDNIDQLLASMSQVDEVARQYNDQALLLKSEELRTFALQYKDLFTKVVAEQQTNKQLVVEMGDKGTAFVNQAKAYMDDTIGKTDDESLLAQPLALDVWNSAMQIRLTQYKFMDRKNDLYWDMLQDEIKQIDTKFNNLEKITTVQYNLDRIAKARLATSEYSKTADEWVKNDQDLQVMLKQMDDLGAKVQDSAVQIEDTGWAAAEDSRVRSDGVISQAMLFTLAAVGAAILLGLLLSLIVSRSITLPLAVLTGALQNIQRGDLNRDMTDRQRELLTNRNDEIGVAGKAEIECGKYLLELADAASQVAEGDLTTIIIPRSEKDELGRALAHMVESLQGVVSKVTQNAAELQSASQHLAMSSNQAGLATSQIASTIQQVARGTAQQAEIDHTYCWRGGANVTGYQWRCAGCTRSGSCRCAGFDHHH